MQCKFCYFCDMFIPKNKIKYIHRNKKHYNINFFLNVRFPVAIKAPRTTNDNELQTFWEEAKSMVEVGTYHDYIVNLQGIVVNEVNHTFLLFRLCTILDINYKCY